MQQQKNQWQTKAAAEAISEAVAVVTESGHKVAVADKAAAAGKAIVDKAALKA